jgi:transmembrane sensor
VLAAVASSWAVEYVGVRGVDTAVGEQQRIVLVDGSCVTLNTASRLRIDYRFGRRRILLERGEALFDVAHDPSHPFVVQAGQSIVTALGTEFAVAKSVQGVEVSVLEGRVRAGSVRAREAIRPSVVLTAGQAGRLVPGNREWIRGDADAGRIKAWQAARLQFQNETLEAVVTEFNRYSTTQLVLEDAQLAALPVSGVFRIGQTESLVRALVDVYPIKARRESTRILLRLAPSSATPMQYIVKGRETQAAPSDRPQGQMPRISE